MINDQWWSYSQSLCSGWSPPQRGDGGGGNSARQPWQLEGNDDLDDGVGYDDDDDDGGDEGISCSDGDSECLIMMFNILSGELGQLADIPGHPGQLRPRAWPRSKSCNWACDSDQEILLCGFRGAQTWDEDTGRRLVHLVQKQEGFPVQVVHPWPRQPQMVQWGHQPGNPKGDDTAEQHIQVSVWLWWQIFSDLIITKPNLF